MAELTTCTDCRNLFFNPNSYEAVPIPRCLRCRERRAKRAEDGRVAREKADLFHNNKASKAPRPRRPTKAQPGSEEKVRVLEERVARGEGLWHPDDSTGDAT